MTKQELIIKLQGIEWEDFEVKSAKGGLPKSSWESVSAFSNSNGGWLIFGVEEIKDDFKIIGVSNPAKLEHDFLNTKIIVNASKQDFGEKTVLAFYVPISKQKPINFNALANTYIRSGSSDRKATKEEIDTMYRDQAFGTKTSEIIEDFSIEKLW